MRQCFTIVFAALQDGIANPECLKGKPGINLNSFLLEFVLEIVPYGYKF
jgi:hypothetical protein